MLFTQRILSAVYSAQHSMMFYHYSEIEEISPMNHFSKWSTGENSKKSSCLYPNSYVKAVQLNFQYTVERFKYVVRVDIDAS